MTPALRPVTVGEIAQFVHAVRFAHIESAEDFAALRGVAAKLDARLSTIDRRVVADPATVLQAALAEPASLPATAALREALERLRDASLMIASRKLAATEDEIEEFGAAMEYARAALAASEPTPEPVGCEHRYVQPKGSPPTWFCVACKEAVYVPDAPPVAAASEGAGEGLDPAKRAELIAFHGQQCNRVVNGYCGTGRCLKRGGYSGAGSVDYNAATCEAWETIQALSEPAPPAAQPPPTREGEKLHPMERLRRKVQDMPAWERPYHGPGAIDRPPAPPASDDGEGARYVVRKNPAPPPAEPSPWAPWQVVSTDHPTETLVMCGCWWEGAARKIADALNAAGRRPAPHPAAVRGKIRGEGGFAARPHL